MQPNQVLADAGIEDGRDVIGVDSIFEEDVIGAMKWKELPLVHGESIPDGDVWHENLRPTRQVAGSSIVPIIPLLPPFAHAMPRFQLSAPLLKPSPRLRIA